MSRDAVAELVHRYADAVVYRDAQRWADTWAPDAVWRLGPAREVVGQQAIVALWHSAIGKYRSVVQNVLNGEVHFDEDGQRATGRWYIIEHFARHDGLPGILLAHYDDTYVLHEGSWRFASRQLHVQYQGAPDLSDPFRITFERE